MIKLVAADMDGTLLNSKKELSPKLFPMIEQLHDKKVRFAVASGRQYYNLVKLYDAFKNDITFICDNGAAIFEKGENIFYDAIALDDVLELIDTIDKIEGAFIVLCGLKSAYIASNEKGFKRHVDMYYDRCERVNDLKEVAKKDPICKIAIFHEDAERFVFPYFKQLSNRFKVAISGQNWLDLMNNHINKGEAIKKIREKYNISYEETMAFGDYLNDYEMMQACHYSYAMENGHPNILAVANFVAPSNEDDGVVKVLEQFIEKM